MLSERRVIGRKVKNLYEVGTTPLLERHQPGVAIVPGRQEAPHREARVRYVGHVERSTTIGDSLHPGAADTEA